MTDENNNNDDGDLDVIFYFFIAWRANKYGDAPDIIFPIIN